jgi:DNA-binding MarR family transcriptional regulator
MTTGRRVDEETALAAEVWGALLRVHAALVPAIDREMQAAHRLPLAWYDVLLELNSAPDRRLRMSDLGERVVLSRTRVSRLVDELSAAALVEKVANPDDRRSAYAALTVKGRNIFRQAAPDYLRSIREHFGDALTRVELVTIRDALDRVLQDQHPA